MIATRLLLFLFLALVSGKVGAQTEIPTRAERVVAIDWGLAETLIAIGAPPVGLAESRGYREWVAAPALPTSVAEIGLRSTPNLEYIAALAPDVILSTPQFASIEPVLSSIAPVMSLATYTDELAPYRNASAITRRLGDLVGRADAAERLIEETDRRIGALATSIEGAPTRPVLVLNFHDDRNVWVFTEGSLFDAVLERAGLRNAWTGTGNAWGIANATIDQFASMKDVAVLLVEPLPLSIREKLERGKADGLLGGMSIFDPGHYRILDPVWGFGALPSAGRFAEARAREANFLKAADGS